MSHFETRRPRGDPGEVGTLSGGLRTNHRVGGAPARSWKGGSMRLGRQVLSLTLVHDRSTSGLVPSTRVGD